MNPIDEALAAKASMTKEASGGLRGLIGDAGKAVMKDARRGAVEGAAGALAGAPASKRLNSKRQVGTGRLVQWVAFFENSGNIASERAA